MPLSGAASTAARANGIDPLCRAFGYVMTRAQHATQADRRGARNRRAGAQPSTRSIPLLLGITMHHEVRQVRDGSSYIQGTDCA